MTPQEVSDYKCRWMISGNNHPVRIHSDLVDQAKTWCRRNLERQYWSMTSWTNVYEHTFFFELESNANQFKLTFAEWVDQ
jgi:hypothetical protein